MYDSGACRGDSPGPPRRTGMAAERDFDPEEEYWRTIRECEESSKWIIRLLRRAGIRAEPGTCPCIVGGTVRAGSPDEAARRIAGALGAELDNEGRPAKSWADAWLYLTRDDNYAIRIERVGRGRYLFMV